MASALAVGYVAAILLDFSLDEASMAALAAAIVMPAPAVQAVLRHFGPRAERIAQAFIVPLEIARRRIHRLGVRLASGEFVAGTWREIA